MSQTPLFIRSYHQFFENLYSLWSSPSASRFAPPGPAGFPRAQTPRTAVQRLVAIVSHDKVMAVRHCNRLKVAVATLWIHNNGVRGLAQAFRIFYRPASGRVAVQAFANPWAIGLLFGRLTVDIQHLVAVAD